MTPRERVARAVKRQPTDRLPLDFRAVPQVYAALRTHLNCATDEEVNRRLGSDIRYLERQFGRCREPLDRTMPDGTSVNFWGIGYRASTNAFGGATWTSIPPLVQAKTVDEVRRHRWPDPDWWDYDMAEVLRRYSGGEEYWLSVFGSSLLGRTCELRGMEQVFLDIAEGSEVLVAILDRVTDFFCGQIERVLKAGGGRIDMVESMDDYGSQNGLLISPDAWRRTIKPRLQRFNDTVRAGGAVVFQHSCGSILPIIEDLIEIGVQVLDPLQFSANNMDPAVLMERFGNRLSFHGGIDIQQLMPRSSPEEICREASRIIETLGARHGYILAGTHLFQADTAPEKIVALYDHACVGTLPAWRGRYPIPRREE